MRDAAIVLGFIAIFVFMATMKSAFADASLDPCPESPNCVSSLEPEDRENYVPPLAFNGAPETAWEVLQETLSTMEGFYEVLWAGGEKMHAVFKTSFFGFKDDVTFLLDAEHSLVQIRSASRIGWFDFGTNRSRIERIRETLPPPFVSTPVESTS